MIDYTYCECFTLLKLFDVHKMKKKHKLIILSVMFENIFKKKILHNNKTKKTNLFLNAFILTIS